MLKRILYFVTSLFLCMSLMFSQAISEDGFRLSTAFDSLVSDEPLLNATEVINSVPEEYRPDHYHDLFLYMLVLEDAESKGGLTKAQVSTLAHYTSEICTFVEKDCASFYYKSTKGRVKPERNISISFNAGIAAYHESARSVSTTKYGRIIQATDSNISILWNDGSSETYLIKGDTGKRTLTDASYSSIVYNEIARFSGAYSELLGAYNMYYLDGK